MHGRSGMRTTGVMIALAVVGALSTGVAAARAGQSTVIGQWRFDERAGQTAVDDGPFGLDGRLGASDDVDPQDPERVAGVSGGALSFDGHRFVRLSNSPQLEPPHVAVEAVLRGDGSPGTFRYVISHGAQGCLAGSYGLYTGADGGIAFYIFDGSAYQVSAAAAVPDIWNGAWHHVAGIFDGAAVRLYVDGHPIGAPQPARVDIAYDLTSASSFIGSYEGTCSLPLSGAVDLARIWNGALSPDFVGTLSDAALTAPPTPPPTTFSAATVPVATEADSQGDAPAGRATLTAAASGTSIPVSPSTAPPPSTKADPPAPARACVVRASSAPVHAGRRTVVTVRVAVRGRPVKAAKVVAIEASSRRSLGSARTARNGRARLGVKPMRRGKVVLRVANRTDCAPTSLEVLRAGSSR